MFAAVVSSRSMLMLLKGAIISQQFAHRNRGSRHKIVRLVSPLRRAIQFEDRGFFAAATATRTLREDRALLGEDFRYRFAPGHRKIVAREQFHQRKDAIAIDRGSRGRKLVS